jgi:hypothetical protein
LPESDLDTAMNRIVYRGTGLLEKQRPSAIVFYTAGQL